MKKLWMVMAVCLLFSCLSGCDTGGQESKKVKDLEFTVVEAEEIPDELSEIIQEKKVQEMKLAYKAGGFLYMVRGYGKQKTGGYSIAVNEVYLGEDGIHADTSLLGPPADKKMKEEPSYPYAVIKIELREEPVLYD